MCISGGNNEHNSLKQPKHANLQKVHPGMMNGAGYHNNCANTSSD